MAHDPERGPAVHTFAAREAARRIYEKAGTGVMKLGARAPAVVALSMPLDWMAEGFLRAVGRFEAADVPAPVETKDACTPLFEALSWLRAIETTHKPPALKTGNQGDLRALRFIRNRQHHHKAAPIRRGQNVDQWIWHSADTIPEPQRSDYRGLRAEFRYRRDLDRTGERIYRKQLADKPVRDVLNRLAQRVGPLAG